MFRFLGRIFLILLATTVAFAEDWATLESKWTPAVVILESNQSIALDMHKPGYSLVATGFIADLKRGIVVTNLHVTGVQPNNLKISFFNNKTLPAKVLYRDPWHDFAFVQFDPKKLDPETQSKIKEVKFGRHDELKTGEEIMLIGNSSGRGLSRKTGNISKLFINSESGDTDFGRHSHMIHTSLPRAGGASGAPLFNSQGRVIGIHAEGDENESFEVRIDYVTDALTQIQQDKIPRRGDAQVLLKIIPRSVAEDNFGYPSDIIEKAPKENADLHFVLQVKKIIPGSDADRVLDPGDLIVGVDGKLIGYSLYDFDRIVNEKVGQKVRISVFKNSKREIIHDVIDVIDANRSYVDEYSIFMDAVFQNVTRNISLNFGIPTIKGVFMPQASSGSAFANIAYNVVKEDASFKYAVIQQIQGQNIENLNDFNQIIKKIPSGSEINITICDMWSSSQYSRCYPISILYPEGEELRTYRRNDRTLEWDLIK